MLKYFDSIVDWLANSPSQLLRGYDEIKKVLHSKICLWTEKGIFICIILFKKFSKTRFYEIFWLLNPFRKHPGLYYGKFGILFKLPLGMVILFYFVVFFISASFFGLFYDISHQSDSSEILYFDKLYFSAITQLSPGFTDYRPNNTASKMIVIFQSLLGLVFNALFVSLIFSRAVHPQNPFEVVPFLLYNPERKRISIRFYSKFPEAIHDLNFEFYRFIIYNNEIGQVMGRRDRIKIITEKKKVLLPFYGLVLLIDVQDVNNDWIGKPDSAESGFSFIPANWLSVESKLSGHYHLVLSGDTSAGKTFQIINYYINKKQVRCGEHFLLNHEVPLDINTWYKYHLYRWDHWEKHAPPKCNKCSLTNCFLKST